MSKKTNTILTILLASLYIASFFLPVLRFSFGRDINGITAFVIHATSLGFVESYGEYLWKMFALITPILGFVLLLWTLRKKINIIPLIIVSLMTLIGAYSWYIKYSELSILLYGYYVWLIALNGIISLNFFKFKYQHKIEPNIDNGK